VTVSSRFGDPKADCWGASFVAESDTVTVTVTPTREDLKALARAFRRRMGYGLRFAAVLIAGALFAVIAFELPQFLMQGFGLPLEMASIVAWFLGFALVLLAIIRLNRAFHRRRLDPKGAFLRGYVVTAGPDGVSLTSEVMETRYRWPAFLRLHEAPEHFFLYVDGASAVVIPKRSFASSDDTADFAALARAHIPAE
jgi:hypothetical protein